MKIENYKNSKIFRKADFIIIVIVIIIAIAAMIIAFQPHGNYVEVNLNGEIIYRVPLNLDREIELQNIGIIIINNNTVRLIEADCPDKLCEIQGNISRSGQRIICLPNKLVISISGKSEWDVIV